MELQPHQQRVVEERNALLEKIAKLEAFIVSNPQFQMLPSLEQSHLNMQNSIMRLYLNILNLRINNW